MTRYVTPVDLDSCRIVVVNEILGTRVEKLSPQSPKEALEADGDCALARFWADYQSLCSPEDQASEPIGVAIFQTADQIIIKWHVDGSDMFHLPSLWQLVLDTREEWTHG